VVIRVLLRDRHGVLWVGTNRGLYRFDPKVDENCVPFSPTAGSAPGLEQVPIWDLLQDGSGAIWAATAGEGLHRLDPAELQVARFDARPGDLSSLVSPRVRRLATDGAGRLWIGT
jgi:ligand-binding sensor domain-containing protein